MTREIKFRAWDVKEKRMFIPRHLEFVPRTGIWLSSETIPLKIGCDVKYFNARPLEGNIKNFELMQFTGLKDNNGNDIYEGDLVKFYNNEGNPFKGVVEYQTNVGKFKIDPGFQIKVIDGSIIIGTVSWSRFNKCEVIGNIYEEEYENE